MSQVEHQTLILMKRVRFFWVQTYVAFSLSLHYGSHPQCAHHTLPVKTIACALPSAYQVGMLVSVDRVCVICGLVDGKSP